MTCGQFTAFVNSTNYKMDSSDKFWTITEWNTDAKTSLRSVTFAQDDCHPIVGLSWRQAVAYTEWLSKLSGQDYRAAGWGEWEYAARWDLTSALS